MKSHLSGLPFDLKTEDKVTKKILNAGFTQIEDLLKLLFDIETLPSILTVSLDGCDKVEDENCPTSLSEAIKACQAVVEVSPVHPSVLSASHQNLGVIYYAQGIANHDEADIRYALHYFNSSLNFYVEYIKRNATEETLINYADFRVIAKSLHYLGLIYTYYANYHLAENCFVKDLKIRATLIQGTHQIDNYSMLSCLYLGNTYLNNAQLKLAIKHFDLALTISEQYSNPNDWINGKCYAYIAVCNLHQGRIHLNLAKSVADDFATYFISEAITDFTLASVFFKKACDFYSTPGVNFDPYAHLNVLTWWKSLVYDHAEIELFLLDCMAKGDAERGYTLNQPMQQSSCYIKDAKVTKEDNTDVFNNHQKNFSHYDSSSQMFYKSRQYHQKRLPHSHTSHDSVTLGYNKSSK